jgi:hypothetical protein
MKNTGMKGAGKKATPSLPASSRMQMPSGSGNSKAPMKSLVKGKTKTKMK